MNSVLLVDDECDLLLLGKKFLEKSGEFSVITIESASVAISYLQKEQVDAIVSDYQMPGIDGISFLKAVREQFGDIPFILYTGKGREEIVAMAIDNGVDFYLQKGGDPKSQFTELAHKIKKSIERVQALRRLAENEERMRLALDGTKEGHWDINLATGKSFVSPSGCEMLGYTPEEIQDYGGFKWRKLLHPDDIPKTNAALQDYYEGKSGFFQMEQRLQMKNGDWKWILCRGKVVEYDDNNRPIRYVGTNTDITEQKRAKSDLKESRDYLNQIFSSVKEGIMLIDSHTHEILDINPAALEMIGAKKEDTLHRNCHKFICPAELGKCPISNLHQTVDNSERALLTAGGKNIPIIKNVVPFSFQGRDCLLETFIDNSERKKAHDNLLVAYKQISDAEEELQYQFNELKTLKNTLQASETKFRTIIETTPDVIWDLTIDGIFTYVSSRSNDILGYSPEELIGTSIIDLLPWKSGEEGKNDLIDKMLREYGHFSIDIPFLHKDGKEIIINIRSTHLVDGKGYRIGFRCVVRDVTERIRSMKALSEQTRQVEHLSEQKDLFLYQLAHDLRTPLTPIVGMGPLLLEGITDPDSRELIEIFFNSIQYLQKMVEDILVNAQLNRTNTLHSLEIYDLSHLIDLAIDANQFLADQKELKVENYVQPGINILISKIYANLVFRNLINNAVKYNSPHGMVTISALIIDQDVAISIQDTGIGISSEIIDKIWDELFTGDHARHDPLSKGFGLSIVKKIIELHGGTIEVFSGGYLKGSTFTVYLPMIREKERS